MDVNSMGGAAGVVGFALQWARAQSKWPEWANALVVLGASVAATLMAGMQFGSPGFLPAFWRVLQESAAAGYLASAASHLPGTSNFVPKSNSKGAA